MTTEIMLRLFIPALLSALIAANAASAGVAVKSYKYQHPKGLNNVEQHRLLKQLAALPGTVIQGPKQKFVVRKVVSQSGHTSMIATNLGRNSMNQVGAAIVAQTDCYIPHNTRVQRISMGLTKQGFSFYCRN